MTRARDLAAFVSNADGDIKFDTDTLFIDSSANRVGIGTTTPDTPLHIEDGDVTVGNSTATGDNKLIFKNTSATLAEIRAADTGTGAGALLFTNNGSERMRIDQDGDVGIGTTSPVTNSNYATLTISDTTGGQTHYKSTGGSVTAYIGADSSSSGIGYLATETNHPLLFRTNNTERMRIDSSGNLLVGTTSTTTQTDGFRVFPTGSDGGTLVECFNDDNGTALIVGRGGGNGEAVRFYRGSTEVGSIDVTTTSTSYGTSSDYRLKENVTDVTDGITRVKQLSPKRFNFIADADTTVDGFLAHEAQAVVPEAVTGTHNEVDDDGNAVMQGIDQSKLVPLLTAALKEAITKIETLETENTAIKARLDALEAE